MNPGLRSLWEAFRAAVLDKRVPAGIGFGRALGTGLLLVFLVQLVTGALLSLLYAPTPDHAYASILVIDDHVAGGKLLRGIHHWGSSAVVVLAVFHTARVFFTAAYKSPRQILWLLGMGILVLIGGFSFTGYLLPWDQKAYWATRVGLEIAESAPLAGPWAAEVLRGGPEVGALTLTRLYGMHVVVLPMLLLPLVALHLFLVHRQGITTPGAPVGQEGDKPAPFFPHHVLRELVVGAGALGVVLAVAWWVGPPLEAPANPADAEYVPRPDWYFLGLFQLLKDFDGPLGKVVIPGAAFVSMLFLPFYDRNPSRRWRERPLAMVLGGGFAGAILLFTVRGAMDPGTPSERAPVRELNQARVLAGALGEEPAPEAELEPGLELVAEFECLYCHTLDGEGDEMGGGGPPLEQVGKGRTVEGLKAFLRDPSAEYPETEMMSAGELGMTEEELDVLTAWLDGLAGDGEP